MKMGTIVSPWRYDAAAANALQSVMERSPAILHDASTFATYRSRELEAHGEQDASGRLERRRELSPMDERQLFQMSEFCGE